jgi:hypothetical protein
MRTTIATSLGVVALTLSLAFVALGGHSQGCTKASAQGQANRSATATARICA